MALKRAPIHDYADSCEYDLDVFAAQLRGRLIRPEDANYEDVRTVWNAAQAKRPALIVECADADDVARAVTFAREHDIEISIRSGGHSMTALSTVEGGMMIDLSHMNRIEVDPERRIARAEPGATWGQYAAVAGEYGLATSSGDMHSVGVGGLTLGGGIGWMVRKYGLTIDHVLAVEVVTADGHKLRASEDENQDLFWALRGGGGNFAIATSFELRLQPAGMILGGAVFYAASDFAEGIRQWAEYTKTAPDELTSMAYLMRMPPLPFVPPEAHGAPVFVVMVAYVGDLDEGQKVVAPLKHLGTPLADVISPMPYPALFEFTKEGGVKGLPHRDRTMYLNEVNDELIGTLLDHFLAGDGQFNMVQLRTLGGAMGRVPEEATAFAHRDKPYMLNIINGWADPADTEREIAWTDDLYNATRKYSAGAYVNFLGDEGEARVREAYKPDTYRRLVAIKNRYDPTNFFHNNQNIRPSGGAKH